MDIKKERVPRAVWTLRIGKVLIGIRLIVWVWRISCMNRTSTRGSNSGMIWINQQDRSSYCNMERIKQLGRSRNSRCLQLWWLLILNIWITTTAALISQGIIALEARITRDVERITDLTVDQTPTSEEFRAESAPRTDKAKLKSQLPRNFKILKIKWKLRQSILLLDHQVAPRSELTIPLASSI